ncbi:MAG: prepilin-type N-terminal cleavage/methylation domain-containing protein [Tissierellaceae bacterium]
MKKRKGMTFIEVLVSILLLGIISISILPMVTYSVKFTKWNNIRLNALNLAYTQVEWIKSLDFDKIGIDIEGYSPFGIVDQDKYMDREHEPVIADTRYSIFTNIYWQGETSTTGEPVPQAIKKVDVTVEAMDLSSGKQKEYAVLGTLITREGERVFSEPGSVEIFVYMRSPNNPEKSIKVGMGLNKTLSHFTNTDDDGRALFAGYSQGTYYVEPLSLKNKEIVVLPDGVEGQSGSQNWRAYRQISIPKWNKDNPPTYPSESFLVDFPGYIEVLDISNDAKNFEIVIKPTGDSYMPNEGEDADHMSLKLKLKDIQGIKFWRMWKYEYHIKDNDNIYFLEGEENQEIWDGVFSLYDLDKPSLEKMKLVFAITELDYQINEDGGIESITLGFSSGLGIQNDLRFEINGEEPSRDSYGFSTTNSNKTLKIEFYEPHMFNSEELLLEIVNYQEIMDTKGVALSKGFFLP